MRNIPIILSCFFILSALAISTTGCNSTKKTPQVSMDELYKTWRIDSVYMEGNFIPNNELKGGTIEFSSDNKLITKTGKRENSITFDLKENVIIDRSKPADPGLIIEQLNKEQLILKSQQAGVTKIRMILSPLKY